MTSSLLCVRTGSSSVCFFFFNGTATTEIYTLSLHDALPIHGSVSRGLRVVAANPGARLGLVTLALGHAVMVSVMVMTPLHMSHGDAGLEVIGLVISIHILGMFAFSPLTGMAVDRFGGRAVAVLGSVVLSSATLLASASPEGDSWS